ncbi:MAG TPA: Ni/Fe hydrogenase subunit alpha [Candidatus Methylomirabilis sp.]|nr:Ni/Fe hydrogenase subunit alpha [Candidatus Methylomirabilis sp.]
MRARTRTIKVGALARVEGEGALYVRVKGDQVQEVRLDIYEPPRFFEAFLRGRRFTEAPDLTARICGICPVAYQMSACAAMEDACGVQVDDRIRALRRLLYCGEWMASHTLHIYMLHAPDFLGYDGVIPMARDHAPVVERGLQLKKVGNALMALVGGREVHPVNPRVGGFYRAPARREFAEVEERLRWARDAALETVRWVAGFPFPDFTQDYEFVSLRQAGEYPIDRGRIVSDRGLDIGVREYGEHFAEEQVPHSNALHARLRARGAYLVGPLARYSLNSDALSPLARDAAREAGLGPVCRNPFRSIVVRAVEVLYACDEALRLIGEYERPEPPAVEVPPRAGVGHGCTEAPRGLLYHRYAIGGDGDIAEAAIIPPTSQNQAQIEADLRRFVQASLALPDRELTWRCEQAIRNYDPCISCATHFLTLDIERA